MVQPDTVCFKSYFLKKKRNS